MKRLKEIPGYLLLAAAAVPVVIIVVIVHFLTAGAPEYNAPPQQDGAQVSIQREDPAYMAKVAKMNADIARQLTNELTAPLQPKSDYCKAWRMEVISIATVEPTPTEKMVLDAKAQAEGGDVRAQTNVGVAYLRGEGVAKDYQQAKMWLQKAADQNGRPAEGLLGDFYSLDGRDHDWAEAYFWYSVASIQGTNWGGGWLVHQSCNAARQHLTQEQVSATNARVLKWLKDKKLISADAH